MNNTVASLNELVKHADVNNLKIDDTAFLVSKMVDLSVTSKYGYFMELQIMNNI